MKNYISEAISNLSDCYLNPVSSIGALIKRVFPEERLFIITFFL